MMKASMDDQMPDHEDTTAAGPPEQCYNNEIYGGGVQHDEAFPQVICFQRFRVLIVLF